MLNALVGNARGEPCICGDVVGVVFGREEEQNRTVFTAGGDGLDDVLREWLQRLVLPITDDCREDADAVCPFHCRELRIEFLHLGVREEVHLVDDACVSDARGIRRLGDSEDEDAEAEEEQGEECATSIFHFVHHYAAPPTDQT